MNNASPSSSLVADKPGQYLAQLVVSNGLNPSLPATVLITAAASGPNLVLSPSTLNFGNQPVGTTSNQKGVTITNTGTTSVQVTSFLLSGLNAREFTLRAAGFPLTVPPNGAVILSVTFTPSAEGTRSASIAFYDSTGGFPHGIALLGTGGTSAPMVQLTPPSLSFADQSVGTSSASRSITVTNIGNANLQITGTTIGGSDFAFAPSFTPPSAASPINLAANASTSIPVIFKPTSTGQRSANLSITDNASDSPQLASLSGNGTPAQLSSITVTPSSITFPDQAVGNSSAPSSITVTNNSTGALQITGLTFSGANAGDFSTTSTAPVTLPANGGSAIVPVTFKPSAIGARSATLTIADNSGGSANNVSLSGNGAGNTPPPGISVNPNPLDFQNQAVGVASSPRQITVTNGNSTSTNISLSMAGVNAGEFSIKTARAFSVAAGGSSNISVVFTPQDTGARSALIIVSDDTGGQAHYVSLQGTGGTSAAPAVRLAPLPLAFGNQAVGTSSASQSVTVTNTGNANLQITGVAIGGTNSGDFAFAPPFAPPTPASPINVAANASTTIPVIFTPAATNARAATLMITDNAGDSPQSAALTGTGTSGPPPPVAVNPSSITFPDQTVGNSSPISLITVTNNTTGALQITGLTFSGANIGDFSTTSTAPVPLPANGGAALIPVTFKPSATGARSATLTISDNSGGSAHNVSLSGNGAGNTPPPGITVSPNPLDFHSQTVGVASSPMQITVTNGNSTSAVISLSMGGVNASEFSIKTARSFSVAAGGTGSISVVFTPQATGARSALIIVSDDTGAPGHYVTLQGTGGTSAPAVQLAPVPLAFGDQSVGTNSTPRSLTVTNTGNANLQITSVAIGGTNSGDFAFAPPFAPPTPASPVNVAVNASTTIPVIFTPTATGGRSASLVITDNANDSPQSAALTGNGTPGTLPPVAVTPSSITFPDQTVGNSSPISLITVTNNTTGALQITGLTFSGANIGDFSTTSTAPVPLPANGGAALIPVTFKPSTAGARSATLVIADNSGGSAHNVSLSGNGALGTGLSVTPATLDFQNQAVNVTSSPMPVTVKNIGGTTVNVTGLLMVGMNGSDFTTTGARSFPLAPGATSVLNILFTPKDVGARSATLIISDDTGGTGHSVTLTGTGATAVSGIKTVPSLTFANSQQVGIASPPLQLTITSTGTAPLQINGFSFSGANAGDFSLASSFVLGTTYPITVAANGGTTTIPIVFKPTAKDARTANLVIADNADGSPHSVTLNGTGVIPIVGLGPNPVDFQNQTLGTTSTAMSVTVTNSGNLPLQITGLSLGGTNAGDFIFPANFTQPTAAAPITVAINGGTTTIPLQFKPGDTGSRQGKLLLTDNALDTPQSVSLSGNGVGPKAVISPNPLAFGSQFQKTASAPLPFTITNTGNADLQITSMTFGGANAAEFSFPTNFTPPTPAAPLVVAANSTANLSVIFTPSDLGPRSANLSFADNATTSPQTLNLSGTGAGPTATLSTTSITFPNQGKNTASAPITVTITNTGTAPLNISGFTFTGANPSDFSTTAVAGTVPVNGSINVPITFTPSDLGSRSATLQIADNAAGSPQLVTLSGSGVTAPIFKVTPTGLTFPDQQGGQPSAPLLLTVSNPGTADLVLNGITNSGVNPGDFSFSIAGGGSFPKTVSPGATLGVNVVFTPTDGGMRSATLLFSDNAVGSPHSVSVSGNGIATPPTCTLNPTSLSFQPQPVNTTSLPLTVTCTNTGQSDLEVTSVSFSGSAATEFQVTPNANFVVKKNGGVQTLSVTFTPTAQTTRTATMIIVSNAPNSPQGVLVSGSGRGQGQISLSGLSLGRNLQTLATGSLDVAPSSPLTVTITSSDPTKVLLVSSATDPSGTTQGAAQITGTVPAGQGKFGFGFPGFWVQGLASSGSAQITISAPGYLPATATATLTPSGFILNGPSGAGASFNAVVGVNSNLSVSPVQLDGAGNIVSTSQVLRGGISASVDVAAGPPSVGVIGNSPAVLPAGSASSSTVLFQPLSVGSSTISISQPSGFSTPAVDTQLTATVKSPVLALNSASLGYNQQAPGAGQMTPSSSPLTVTVTSSDPSKVLLSLSPTAVGSNSVMLSVSANTSALPQFYLQGLASSGQVTLTATAQGYTSGTSNVALTPSAFILNGPNGTANFTTTTFSGATNLSLSIWQLDTASRPFSGGQLRPGRSESITVTSSTPSTGAIVGSPAAFNGGDVSNNNLAFDPATNCITPCTTTLNVVQPAGYGAPASGGQIGVTVTAPAITLRINEPTIGNNLEVQAAGALDGPSPTDLQVTITSDNPSVWLSASPITPGAQTLNLTVPAGSGVNAIGFPAYYIQALASSGTTHLTISAPGYLTTTSSVTLAPSALVLSGPNGVGANFGTLLTNGSVGLQVIAVVLDSTGSPSQILQQVRGGLSPSVTVTSDSPAAVVSGSPLTIAAGTSSGSVTLQLQAKGTANISATTPPGFTTPAFGTHLTAQIN